MDLLESAHGSRLTLGGWRESATHSWLELQSRWVDPRPDWRREQTPSLGRRSGMERRVGINSCILKLRPSLLVQFPHLTEQPDPPCSWMLKA